MGYSLDWKHPRDINEKIQWLLVYGDTTEWTRLADKYKVREYVKEKGLEHLLVPLYGVWDDTKQIDFDALPEKFVIKCNHDYGSTIVVNKNSADYNRKDICEKLDKAETRGIEKGRAEGLAKGMVKGEDMIIALARKLTPGR